MASLISVIIPTVRAGTLECAVQAVLGQTHADFELLVVAQGADPSLEAVLERVAKRDSRVRPLWLAQKGASLARNVGLAAAKGDVIAMTDDDCEPAENWLEVIDGCFRTEPEVGVVGGAVIAPPPARSGPATCPSNRAPESLYDPVAHPRSPPPGWDWLSANVAVRRWVVQRVGPFDECLGPGTPFPAWEDPDWKIRMEALGVKMRVTPRSLVHHTHGIRYGYQAIWNHLRNYALGGGAFAAKYVLRGDARGKQLVREMRARAIRPGRAFPADMMRWHYFRKAYKDCMSGYHVPHGTALLVPNSSRRSVRMSPLSAA